MQPPSILSVLPQRDKRAQGKKKKKENANGGACGNNRNQISFYIFSSKIYNMSDTQPSTDDILNGLSAWWLRNCKAFSIWFISMNTLEQSRVILEACPDIPKTVDINNPTKLTDIIVPDMELDGLLKGDGKLFILFMTRALSHMNVSFAEDLKRIKTLHNQGCLPDLTQGSAVDFSTPHVDPKDPDENVRAICEDMLDSKKKAIEKDLADDKLIELNVWLALKLRRMTIATFVLGIAETYQKLVRDKPSPTARALIQSEFEMRKHSSVAAVREEKDNSKNPVPGHIFSKFT